MRQREVEWTCTSLRRHVWAVDPKLNQPGHVSDIRRCTRVTKLCVDQRVDTSIIDRCAYGREKATHVAVVESYRRIIERALKQVRGNDGSIRLHLDEPRAEVDQRRDDRISRARGRSSQRFARCSDVSTLSSRSPRGRCFRCGSLLRRGEFHNASWLR